MNEISFQDLRDANVTRCIEWMGHKPDRKNLAFHGLELGGEVGEALNIMKKLERGQMGMPGELNLIAGMHKLAKELADVVVCVDIIASLYGINLADEIEAKFNETSDKHGFETHL